MKLVYINNIFVAITLCGVINCALYGDFGKMISGLEYFGVEIDSSKVDVKFNGELIVSADWESEDGLHYNQVYVYEGSDLIFIEEYVEESLSKHIYFIESDKSDEYFSHIYGKSFSSTDDYITEVQYTRNRLPISYEFSSISNEKIGSIDLTYDGKDHLIKETWYYRENKIREFENRFDPTKGTYYIIERDGSGNITRTENIK